MHYIYRESYVEGRQNEQLVLTMMSHNAIGIVERGLQESPFLLQGMTAPHVPHGITKRLPVDVSLTVNIERSDPMHLLVSRTEITNRGHVLVNQDVTIVFFPASGLTFVFNLAFERLRPIKLHEKDVITG
jgi:hypothetical protein